MQPIQLTLWRLLQETASLQAEPILIMVILTIMSDLLSIYVFSSGKVSLELHVIRSKLSLSLNIAMGAFDFKFSILHILSIAASVMFN